MKIAIIDCGTNTFHLMIVEIVDDKVSRFLFKTKATVKLGEGGITKQFISGRPFKRGIAALKSFNKWIRHYEVEKVTAYATAAIRNAENGNDFIKTVKDLTGLTVESISGDKEAELIYKGVRNAVQLGSAVSLIMDIGGGSTEFVIGNKDDILWRKSFPLGAALLLEKFKLSDPISMDEANRIGNFLDDSLVPLFSACESFKPDTLVGSSGSFESFAEMIAMQKLKKGVSKGKTSYDFIMHQYVELHQSLLSSKRQEREAMKGLVKMRVDMIVISSLLLTFVLNKTGILKMKLSTYALKEGILAESIDQLN